LLFGEVDNSTVLAMVDGSAIEFDRLSELNSGQWAALEAAPADVTCAGNA
jgi:hypothetical protein